MKKVTRHLIIIVLFTTLIYLALRFSKFEFFPCQTKPVIEPSLNPVYHWDWCALHMLSNDWVGINIRPGILGYGTILLTIGIPALLLSKYFTKKFWK